MREHHLCCLLCDRYRMSMHSIHPLPHFQIHAADSDRRHKPMVHFPFGTGSPGRLNRKRRKDTHDLARKRLWYRLPCCFFHFIQRDSALHALGLSDFELRQEAENLHRCSGLSRLSGDLGADHHIRQGCKTEHRHRPARAKTAGAGKGTITAAFAETLQIRRWEITSKRFKKAVMGRSCLMNSSSAPRAARFAPAQNFFAKEKDREPFGSLSFHLVEISGSEPLTYWMPFKRSPELMGKRP